MAKEDPGTLLSHTFWLEVWDGALDSAFLTECDAAVLRIHVSM